MPRADPEVEAAMEQMEAGLDKINGTTGSKEVSRPLNVKGKNTPH